MILDCTKVTFFKGTLLKTIIRDRQAYYNQGIKFRINYNWLSVYEVGCILKLQMYKHIYKEYYRRIRYIRRSEFNLKHRLDAVNTLTILVTHSFNIIRLFIIGISKVNTKLCNRLTVHRRFTTVNRRFK